MAENVEEVVSPVYIFFLRGNNKKTFHKLAEKTALYLGLLEQNNANCFRESISDFQPGQPSFCFVNNSV